MRTGTCSLPARNVTTDRLPGPVGITRSIVPLMLSLFFLGCGAAPMTGPDAESVGHVNSQAADPKAPAPVVDEHADFIQGGAKDSKDPAVGLVWMSGGGFCTGTLIAPDVVLTAGHCVATTVSAFYTGAGKAAHDVGRSPVSGLVAHRVVDQIAHPAYQEINQCPNPTFDVALLLLAGPIANITPLSVATSSPRVGTTCRAVGYGVHNDARGAITIEQKRSASEKVRAVDDSSIEVEKKTGIVDHGDSGGPLLCGKKIAGTTSCGNDSSPSHRQAYYARVDSVADWIDQTIAGWQ